MFAVIAATVFFLIIFAEGAAASRAIIIGGWSSKSSEEKREELAYLERGIPGAISVVPSRNWPISEAARDVLAQLRGKGVSDKLILVAHSWGGLIAREIGVRHPELVEKIITIASPAGGFKFTPRFIYGVDDEECNVPLYIIVGNKEVSPRWYMSGILNDGVVEYDSAMSLGKRKVQGFALFPGLGHVELLESPDVLQQVLEWIRREENP